MALTIRTQPEHEKMISEVGELMGEKTASQTLLRAVMEHKGLCNDNARLRQELARAQQRLREHEYKVECYKQAREALFGS
ncbi:hypothetical protein EC847_12810 [Scandinavium goeteborgense]|uniref:Uncharacterized protein n=2 Tax=Scandinavium goeteborgense TaxID=1851514 RepID=A0A4R6DTY8_SCAGO|nr:hypothetical protein EC847_12810 [Scandinavium goeteborgense]